MKKSFIDGSDWINTVEIQGFRVETVFLRINRNLTETGPPLWFEPKVSRISAGGKTIAVKIKGETPRCFTVADALAGRVVICEKVKSGKIGK